MATTAGVGCLFCAIAAGERSAHVVLDTPAVVAFLDHRPLFPGHTLVVPRAHVETLTDLPPADLGEYFARVQQMTAAVETATEFALLELFMRHAGETLSRVQLLDGAWDMATSTWCPATARTACGGSSGPGSATRTTPTPRRSRPPSGSSWPGCSDRYNVIL